MWNLSFLYNVLRNNKINNLPQSSCLAVIPYVCGVFDTINILMNNL